jgi:hypothetical protein
MRVEVTEQHLNGLKSTVWEIHVNGRYVWYERVQSDATSLALNLARALGLKRRKGSVWTSPKVKAAPPAGR